MIASLVSFTCALRALPIQTFNQIRCSIADIWKAFKLVMLIPFPQKAIFYLLRPSGFKNDVISRLRAIVQHTVVRVIAVSYMVDPKR